MYKIPEESSICVLTADMFAIPSTTFKLPSYVARLAHQFAEALFSPPPCTHIFNKFVLDFLDVEAKQGEGSDRDSNPNH